MQAGDRNTFFEDRKLGRAALSVSEKKVFGQDPLATEFFTTLMESLILAQDECWRHA